MTVAIATTGGLAKIIKSNPKLPAVVRPMQVVLGLMIHYSTFADKVG